MIERSLMSRGNTKRAEKAIEKARSGEAVTIAFIGGSITQGAGAIPINTECYAYKAYQSFAKAYGTGENVHLSRLVSVEPHPNLECFDLKGTY